MTCVWSKADEVARTVARLASKHGLAVFDPQEGSVSYPGSGGREYDALNDFGLGKATTPVGGGGGLLKVIIGWFRG